MEEWSSLLNDVKYAQLKAQSQYQEALRELTMMKDNPNYISNVDIATQRQNVSTLEQESTNMQKLLEWVATNAKSGESIEQKITVPVYIGNERIDEIVARVSSNQNYRSGGR